MDVEETRKFIGADSLAFLPLPSLLSSFGEAAPSFCDACFSGNYPVPWDHVEEGESDGELFPTTRQSRVLTGGPLLDEDRLEVAGAEAGEGAAAEAGMSAVAAQGD